MGITTLSLLLAALLGQDWLPPAPEVLFTQVDETGRELGDTYRSICAGDTCRVVFPADFETRACMVNAVVRLPVTGLRGTILFSVSPCVPSVPKDERPNLSQSAEFTLDRYAAASDVIKLASVGSCLPARDDPAFRGCRFGEVRVDILLWTAARR